MIVDTTFLIDIMEKLPEAEEILNKLSKNGEPLLVTSLSIFELYTGIIRSQNPIKEKNKILKALQDQVILSLDEKSAEKAGEIDGILIKEGNMLGIIDCMIAGIAFIKNEKVLTRNIKDFSKIRGLKIETY